MFQIALAILPLLAAAPAEEVVEDLENQEVVVYEEEDCGDVVIYEDSSSEDQDCLEEEIVFNSEEASGEDPASFEEN